MKNITVVGKNSSLYKKLNFKSENQVFNVKELSFSDIDGYNELIENPVIFSLAKDINENIKFLKKVVLKSTGKIILISSTASEVYGHIKCYSYPKNKYVSERFISSLPNSIVVRVGITVENINLLKGFHGRVKVTTYDVLLKTLSDIFIEESNKRIIDTTKCIFLKGSLIFQLFHQIQYFIFTQNTYLFYIFRPALILFKLFKYKNYGYTFIANQI